MPCCSPSGAAKKTKERCCVSCNSTEDRPVNLIQVGDRLAVRPDEAFAVDGTVRSGESAVDESGVKVSVPGMSSLRFRNGLVCEENDHYSATDVLKTLVRFHPIRTLMMAKKDLLS